MSNIIKQVLLQSRTPLAQTQRYRGKINIERPKAPHYERARTVAATQPVLPEPLKTTTCFQPNKERYLATVESPYNAIIAREVRNWLEHSRTVGIFHLNSIKAEDIFRVRVELHKQNMHLKSYGKKIISMAVENTRFEAIVPLFESNHCIVFSTNESIGPLLRIIRKVPQMILIAGIVENRLMSRNELISYAQLPNIQMVQAELVSTLNMAAGNLVKQLETHQNNFVNVLDVYAKSAKSEEVVDKQVESNVANDEAKVSTEAVKAQEETLTTTAANAAEEEPKKKD